MKSQAWTMSRATLRKVSSNSIALRRCWISSKSFWVWLRSEFVLLLIIEPIKLNVWFYVSSTRQDGDQLKFWLQNQILRVKLPLKCFDKERFWKKFLGMVYLSRVQKLIRVRIKRLTWMKLVHPPGTTAVSNLSSFKIFLVPSLICIGMSPKQAVEGGKSRAQKYDASNLRSAHRSSRFCLASRESTCSCTSQWFSDLGTCDSARQTACIWGRQNVQST